MLDGGELIQFRLHRIRRVTPASGEMVETVQPDPAPLPFDAEDAVPSGPPPRGSQASDLGVAQAAGGADRGNGRERGTDDLCGYVGRPAAGIPGAGSLDPAEAAHAVRCGLVVPAVAAMRDRLVPEYPVACSVLEDAEEVVTWGVAEAIAWSGTRPELVVDWKAT